LGTPVDFVFFAFRLLCGVNDIHFTLFACYGLKRFRPFIRNPSYFSVSWDESSLTVMLGSDVLGASNFVEVLLLAPATEVYFGHVMPRFEVVFESLLCCVKVCAFRAFGRNFHFFGSG
jgi:hypothetical protein